MSQSEILAMETIAPSSSHTHTVINLHGRGSNASEYRKEFFEGEDSLGKTVLETFPSIKWVFPSARQISSRRFQCLMSQWFDMWSTDDPNERSEEQVPQLRKSLIAIAEIVRQEGNIVGMENIILCGISQGAATATGVLFELDAPLCAFIGFATWLPGCFVHNPLIPDGPRKTPVFLAHCQDDNIIDIKYGETLRDRLDQFGMPIDFHSYKDGGHWLNEPQGIDDLISFLQKVTVERRDECP